MFRSGCAVLAAFLILSACSREEATTRLKDDLPVEELRIIHARFPCWSPDLHFFGYRFRVDAEGGIRRWRYMLELFNSTMDVANSSGVPPLAP